MDKFKNQFSANTRLSKQIMRRVYYVFVLRLATHPVFAHGLLLLALVWWLKELVFFARIWDSFIATPIGEIGSFAVGLILNADALTLLVTVTLVAIGGLWLRQLLRIRLPKLVRLA